MKCIAPFALFILVMSHAAALEQKDVSIEITLPITLEADKAYDKPFLLLNRNDTRGTDDALLVSVSYALEMNGTVIAENVTQKKLNYFSKSGIAEFTFALEARYLLCAAITPQNYDDPNPSNDEDCKELFLGNASSNATPNETEIDACDCGLYIDSQKEVYNDGESLQFTIGACATIDDGASYSLPIEYWVEDIRGNVEKGMIATTAKTPKSYTPSIDEHERTFIVKANVQNCSEKYSKTATFIRDTPNESSIVVESPAKVDSLKPFIVNITGYRNGTDKKTLNLWVESAKRISEITKVKAEGKNSNFSFEAPIIIASGYAGEAKLVVEGLGFALEKEMEVIGEADERKSEGKQSSDPVPAIKSFYTRKKKFDTSITVYISTDNADGMDIEIESLAETKTVPAGDDTVSVNITIRRYDENLTATLLDGGKEVDKKTLELGLEPGVIEEAVKSEEGIAKPDEKEQEHANVKDDDSDQRTPEVTGAVTEEQSVLTGNAHWLIIALVAVPLFSKPVRAYIKTKIFKRK